ncbi:MAG: hypothetical protein J6866_06125, partial [Victivallales bacterium]|nr:hypothetical protein [Victivallales bacterium]
GTTVAKTPRQTSRTNDITGGLPRVAELFEARRPREAAVIATIDGYVFISPDSIANVKKNAPPKNNGNAGTSKRSSIGKDKRTIVIKDPESADYEEQIIPKGKRIIVFDGDFVRKGTPLTEGSPVLTDLLEVCGPQELQEFLVNEVQQVYRTQGVEINDKHIEIIVRQMMRRVRITEPGNTKFLAGEAVDIQEFNKENKRQAEEGGEPAEAEPMLQGITKAALATDSFISAASFQDTTRILTEAATLGRVDYLRGFKENVIMGHLIPAGTGYYKAQNVRLEFNTEGLDLEDEQDSHKLEDRGAMDLESLDKHLDF